MQTSAKIFVAGHRGMVGSAIVRALGQRGFENIVTRTSAALDLRDGEATAAFFASEKPDHVFLAAAKVGGILANDRYRADFIHDNLSIQSNVIHQSYLNGVKKLLFLGSSCIYPRDCPQPIKEEYLLTGPLETTNEAYAIAKIAGLKMCEAYRHQHGCDFIAAMPTNLYGPNDNYHPQNSHVLPALLRKFVEAREEGRDEVIVWGTGQPKREFLHADDLADACLFLMENYSEASPVNIGTGTDLSIGALAEMISSITGFTGRISFDTTKPDGTPRKLLDVSKLRRLGWSHRIPMEEGLRSTHRDFLLHHRNTALATS